MKKVVLDTNVLLVSISSKSKLHRIYENLIQGNFILCLTTDILLEYEEIIELKMDVSASSNALSVLENLQNVEFITKYYQFGLLKDNDDNKFVDCALAANADFIVTHDTDFNLLKIIKFPKVSIVNTSEFKEILE